MIKSTAALVLAGGSSRRMGAPKATLAWGKQTVLRHILEQIRVTGIRDILVVSGAHHDSIERDLRGLGVGLSRNPRWEEGMGSSTVWGIQEIQKRFPDSHGVLILLVDQPLVDAGYLTRILNTAAQSPETMIGSDYPEGPGVPAFFPAKYFNLLRDLGCDQGAKKLLRDPSHAVISLAAGAKTSDMDTPEAYSTLIKKSGIKKEKQ